MEQVFVSRLVGGHASSNSPTAARRSRPDPIADSRGHQVLRQYALRVMARGCRRGSGEGVPATSSTRRPDVRARRRARVDVADGAGGRARADLFDLYRDPVQPGRRGVSGGALGTPFFLLTTAEPASLFADAYQPGPAGDRRRDRGRHLIDDPSPVRRPAWHGASVSFQFGTRRPPTVRRPLCKHGLTRRRHVQRCKLVGFRRRARSTIGRSRPPTSELLTALTSSSPRPRRRHRRRARGPHRPVTRRSRDAARRCARRAPALRERRATWHSR